MRQIRAVFAGNPNCGKTTLFNALAGTNLKTANYPGVTVEKRSAAFSYDGAQLLCFDLPGIYDLHHADAEEKISKDTLEEKEYDVIVNVLDATCLAHGLYLTHQLLALEKPVIVVLNMMDAAQSTGIGIDVQKLQKALGTTVCPVSAKKKTGFSALYQALLHPPFPKNAIVHDDPFPVIDRIVQQCVTQKYKQHSLTDRIDRVVLHPFWGSLFLFLVMGTIFYLTFALGDEIKSLLQNGLSVLSEQLEVWLCAFGAAPFARSLLIDGVLGGIGSILSFLPNLVILFLLLSLLQDSGYMARIACLTDGLMHRVHLSGKASIALVLALGCSVPAVTATRIESDRKTRIRTMLAVPFLSCGARLPIYVLFAGTFFPKNSVPVIFLLYILGLLAALMWAWILSGKEEKEKDSRLLLELPDYRFPHLQSVAVDVWSKVRDYLTRAATVVLAASVLLWCMTHLSPDGYTTDITESFAAKLGQILVPILRPAGLGFWQIAVALIAGIWAKEIVVSYTHILFGQALDTAMGAPNAMSMMLFCLLYVPCAATLAAIRRESDSPWVMVQSLAAHLITAYGVCVIFYQISMLIV